MAQRKFIVTLGSANDLDVNDIQEAIVSAAERIHDNDLDHGNVDVELVEVVADHTGTTRKSMIFKVLEAC